MPAPAPAASVSKSQLGAPSGPRASHGSLWLVAGPLHVSEQVWIGHAGHVQEGHACGRRSQSSASRAPMPTRSAAAAMQGRGRGSCQKT